MANRLENEHRSNIKKFIGSFDIIMRAINLYENTPAQNREQLGISEVDYIRLTQFVQDVKKTFAFELYTREKEEENLKEWENGETKEKTEKRKANRIKKFFKRRFSSKEKISTKEIQKSPEKIIGHSYVLCEICKQDLEELLRTSNEIEQANPETETTEEEINNMLNSVPGGNIINSIEDGPGILDDYRQKSWGIERICLDGMQNHLPSDAKGSKCFLHFMVDGEWVDYITAMQNRDRITQIRFADDGVGFTPDNLLYLHSTKTSERDSVGQFGEGMKLASMASINLGLEMEFQSRNWIAHVVGREKTITNTRDNDRKEKRKSLVYQIEEYDGQPIKGSRTIFHTPTPEFIDYALTLPSRILQLDPAYKPKFVARNCQITDYFKGGNLYVKGVLVEPTAKTLFSYNFDDVEVNPDRNSILKNRYGYNFSIQSEVSQCLLELNDKEIIKTIISRLIEYVHEHPDDKDFSSAPAELRCTYELTNAFKNGKGFASIWKEAFQELFENENDKAEDGTVREAILKTDFEIPESLQKNLDKYNIISLPGSWTNLFKTIGIRTDQECLPDYIQQDIETSLSVRYARDWGVERIMLDAVQNHLPSDSGGDVFLRFQTQDGTWHDYSEFPNYSDEQISRIKVCDTGKGYDSQFLNLLGSTKDESSAGKFGEGMKLITCAALREGIQIQFHSRNWTADPYSKKVILNEGQENETQTDKLCFTVTTYFHEDEKFLFDGDTRSRKDSSYYSENEVSSTTFVNPSKDLIQEFRNISEKILLFSEEKPDISLYGTDILDYEKGRLFVKGILIPGNHDIRYSYNLRNFSIEGRDRNFISTEQIQKEIRGVLQSDDSRITESFIMKFLRDANDYAEHPSKRFEEFETPFTIPDSKTADLWIKVFKKFWDESTTIRSSNDRDDVAAGQAQHLGLKTVVLPPTVFDALSRARGLNGEQITTYEKEIIDQVNNTTNVEEDNLTEEEKRTIDYLMRFNKFLVNGEADSQPIKKIKIYEFKNKSRGLVRGYYDTTDIGTIHLARELLHGPMVECVHVLFHESAHLMTRGAEDASPEFRNFLTKRMAINAIKALEKEDSNSSGTTLEDSIRDDGVASDITLSDMDSALTTANATQEKLPDNSTRKVGDE